MEVTVKDGEGHSSARPGMPNPLNKGRLCAKGQTQIEHLYTHNHPDRLKYPLKERGHDYGYASSWSRRSRRSQKS